MVSKSVVYVLFIYLVIYTCYLWFQIVLLSVIYLRKRSCMCLWDLFKKLLEHYITFGTTLNTVLYLQ